MTRATASGIEGPLDPNGLAPLVAAPRAAGYRQVATRGLVWVLFQTGVGKGLSFVAQLVLGWILSEDDYALYALAVGVSSIVSTLRNGGLQKVLMQRGHEYAALAAPVLQVAIVFNLVCAGLLVGAAPLVTQFYHAPGLPPLLWVMAAAIVLSTPAMIFQARVLTDLHFGRSARITAMTSVLQYGSMVLFAVLGFGPMSFVLPLVVVAVYEIIAFGMAAGWLQSWRIVNASLLRELLGASAWVMVSSLAGTLVNQGDVLVIGRMQPDILGLYFFGVTLAIAVATIFGRGLNLVLMPTLVKLSHDPERMGRAYLQSIRTFVLAFTPICVVAAAVADPLVRVLWQGKWDGTIFVVQAFTLSLLFRMLNPFALAALEARGAWRRIATLVTIDAVGTLLATGVGCLIGGLIAVSIAVCANRAGMAMLQCLVVARLNGLRRRSVLLAALPPVLVAGFAAGIALTAALPLQSRAAHWWPEVLFALVFSPAYLALARLLMPRRLTEATALIRSMLARGTR
jgi:O-antigen/teichoic acid export membrane protein